MAIELCDRKDCTGCLACMHACNKGAIYSELSEDGFYYPMINPSQCIGCSACIKACPILSLQPPYQYNKDSHCYSAYQKQTDVRLHSSSGGLFYTLAKYIIDLGGVVYGAGWGENLHLKHQKVDNLKGLQKLMRSKYVQSDLSEVYMDVKQLLNDGRKVLFTGTPCQVAAMRSFFRDKNVDGLFLVDVVCQGVPSPVLFRKYIDEIEAKFHTKVIDVIFRSKKYGWRCGLLLLLLCEDGKTIEIKYGENTFYRAFLRNYMMRESCYNCQFKYPKKGCFSDVTLADFWRIGSRVPFQCDTYECGVSAVLTNTLKGEQLFNVIKNQVVWEERTFEEFSTNGGLKTAVKPKDNKSAFETAKREPFDVVQDSYYPYTLKQKAHDLMNMHLSQPTIFKIKKWLRK